MKNKDISQLPNKANEGDMAMVEYKEQNQCFIFIWNNGEWKYSNVFYGSKEQLKRILRQYHN